MEEEHQKEYISALVELHRDLPRQGPGDRQFALNLLKKLPRLPKNPRIADLGCGTGVAALMLAEFFKSSVKAVDASSIFINELKKQLINKSLNQYIEPVCADMGTLDWPRASIDLLWSEGAAYNLGFNRALNIWRPFLSNSGVAVISEMSWFTDLVPEMVRSFWQTEYPGMGSEKQNLTCAQELGFTEVFTERLPSKAWWENYYNPLRKRILKIEPATAVMQQVIDDIEMEMELFMKYSDYYGYTFYVLTNSNPSSS